MFAGNGLVSGPKGTSWTLWFAARCFPEPHDMDEESIADALGFSHKGCAGMTGQDVGELHALFLANPALHSNPITYWQEVFDRNTGQPNDWEMVDVATARFDRRRRSGKTTRRACLAFWKGIE